MLKKIVLTLALLAAGAVYAAVDINTASEAELDSIKGIGPGTSGKILEERKKGKFKDWNDLVTRVKGIGDIKAVHFSSQGLTVNGAAYPGASQPANSRPGK